MGKASVVAALRRQRDATLSLLGDLNADEWDLPAGGNRGQSVRSVAASLVAVDEAAATGRLLLVLVRSRDTRSLYAWEPPTLNRWRGEPIEALLDGLRLWGERLARLASRVPGLLERVDLRGPYGRQPLLYLLSRRVLDEWVRDRRIAATFGREVARPDPAVAETLATAVLDSLPALVLPGMERTTGVVRLVVIYDADTEQRLTWGIDFARKHYGPRVTRPPDATIRMSAAALAALSEGVDGRFAAEDAIETEGDAKLAGDLLRAIADPTERMRL